MVLISGHSYAPFTDEKIASLFLLMVRMNTLTLASKCSWEKNDLMWIKHLWPCSANSESSFVFVVFSIIDIIINSLRDFIALRLSSVWVIHLVFSERTELYPFLDVKLRAWWQCHLRGHTTHSKSYLKSRYYNFWRDLKVHLPYWDYINL